MVTSFVCERRKVETIKQAAAASQAKQGQWINWHDVEKRKISCGELWAMDANHIKFIGATYDVLQTPQNLSQWLGVRRKLPFLYGCWPIKTHSV